MKVQYGREFVTLEQRLGLFTVIVIASVPPGLSDAACIDYINNHPECVAMQCTDGNQWRGHRDEAGARAPDSKRRPLA